MHDKKLFLSTYMSGLSSVMMHGDVCIYSSDISDLDYNEKFSTREQYQRLWWSLWLCASGSSGPC